MKNNSSPADSIGFLTPVIPASASASAAGGGSARSTPPRRLSAEGLRGSWTVGNGTASGSSGNKPAAPEEEQPGSAAAAAAAAALFGGPGRGAGAGSTAAAAELLGPWGRGTQEDELRAEEAASEGREGSASVGEGVLRPPAAVPQEPEAGPGVRDTYRGGLLGWQR